MTQTEKIINGKKIAERIKDEITLNIFNNKDRRPSLAIILVGDRPDSELYVSLKQREAKKVGIDTHLYRLDAESSEKDLLSVIHFLNQDEAIDAILLQLPLPASFEADKMIAAINPVKDADGFHPDHPDYVISPVMAAVNFIVKDKKIKGRVCVFYRSEIFGRALGQSLTELSLKVDLIPVSANDDPRTDKALQATLVKVSQEADLIVSALGLPGFIKQNYLKKDALIIDIGITNEAGVVRGDADLNDCLAMVTGITPVPGGIGPMTIAFLFKNVWEIYRRR